jgi:pyruvate/2-oxoglutarate dehydrogenase complex dihydrolipoamide acyltransferase (E2) component|tara:strand:- start:546 stop:815 length:270 start_codon:yes stop_codon:yes gene_type:complete
MQRDPEQERTLQMATDIVIPSDLWEEDEETVITGWLADDGATVEEGALVVEIMTAKVQYEINAPASGTLRIKEEADAVVPKGAVIGSVE